MKDLQKLSGRLKSIFHFLTYAIPLFIVFAWLFIEWPPINKIVRTGLFLRPEISTPEGLVDFSTRELPLLCKFIGCFGMLLGSLPTILGCALLKKLFENYQTRKIFLSSNTQIYKKIGWLAFIKGIFTIPVSQTLMVLAATISNPPGHRYITLGFGTPNFEAILCGLIIVVISLVMQEAQKLQEENQLTV